MKKYFLAVLFGLIGFGASAQTQKWAIGLEVGEPNAISIRKYGDRNALDISVGTYIGIFKGKTTYKTSNDKLASLGIMFNGTYLWYAPLFNERMIVYGGPGVQINSRRYYPDRTSDIKTSNISTGPSLRAGMEFFFAAKPTSIFLQGGGYIELLPKIFYFNPNLSLGIHHNF